MAVSLAAVALALALPARAEEEGGKKAEKPKRHEFTGTIESMDAATSTVVIKKKDETKTFTCAPDCKMRTADKKEAALSDFKVGDKVLCSYTEEDGKNICHKMGPPRAKKEKGEKEEKEEKAK
jgi:Cu/Ag efflux protein CusF